MVKADLIELLPKLILPYTLRGRTLDGRVKQTFTCVHDADVAVFVDSGDARWRWDVQN